jgi:hypothetical protein
MAGLLDGILSICGGHVRLSARRAPGKEGLPITAFWRLAPDRSGRSVSGCSVKLTDAHRLILSATCSGSGTIPLSISSFFAN